MINTLTKWYQRGYSVRFTSFIGFRKDFWSFINDQASLSLTKPNTLFHRGNTQFETHQDPGVFKAEESNSWKYQYHWVSDTYNTPPLYGVSPRIPMKEFKHITLFNIDRYWGQGGPILEYMTQPWLLLRVNTWAVYLSPGGVRCRTLILGCFDIFSTG